MVLLLVPFGMLLSWTPPSGGLDLDDEDVRVRVGVLELCEADTTDKKNTLSGHTSIIAGKNNYTSVTKSIIVGQSNKCNGSNNLLVGNANLIGSGVEPDPLNTEQVIPVAPSYNSAAIGWGNTIIASRGWALGWATSVEADKGVAIGTGVIAENPDSVVIGRWNLADQAGDSHPELAEDVFAVGSGLDADNRFSALRVTDDGAVILGRAQGDIAMGIYTN